MFDWDQDNVVVTGSSDGIVRVSVHVNHYWSKLAYVC